MTGEIEDRNYVRLLRKGDVSSYDAIFRKYNKKVYYFALSYLKNKEEAEDVVQEVFMNLWKSREQINESYAFNRYIFRITYNSTCKKFRKFSSDKRHIEEVLKNISVEDNTTNLDVEYNNLLEYIYKLIEMLPVRQKEILLLNIDEHLEAEQIAEKMSISKKSVENYLAKARSSLRLTLTNKGIFSVLFIYLFL